MQEAQASEPGAETRRLLLFVGPDLRPDDALGAALARSGWRCVWLSGSEPALRAAAHAHFDALVVQAEAAGGPPARHIEALRQTLGCPVLVVAPTDNDEVDEIIALELGADAYLSGVLAPRRLRAHLHALMRRGDEPVPTAVAGDPPVLRLGPWSLLREQQQLTRDDRRVPLTDVQCALLQCLGEQAGRVVGRTALADALGGDRALHARSVDVYVARLRRRLREQRVLDIAIEGVRGRAT
jgi:two-component system, OmpR family, phosphate regulon response regulator OmpR